MLWVSEELGVFKGPKIYSQRGKAENTPTYHGLLTQQRKISSIKNNIASDWPEKQELESGAFVYPA